MKESKPLWDAIFTIVINLPKDKDRRLYMEQQLNALSIPHTTLSATDGQMYNFDKDYVEEVALRKNGRSLTPPEKGCALSHRRALQEFLDSGKEYGLIMEDDVVLDPVFPDAIKAALESKRMWSYVQFNYSPTGWKGASLWWFLFAHNKELRNPFQLTVTFFKGVVITALNLLWGLRDMWNRKQKLGKLYRVSRDQYLAGCYLLTREAARALVDLNTPLAYAADRVQNIARRKGILRHVLYVPRIVRQKRESFSSSINNAHFGKKVISY